MTSSINLYENPTRNHHQEEQEEETSSSFFDDFSDGVWEALESTTAKVLIGIQMILFVAIVLVTLSISQHRLLQRLSDAYNDMKHHHDNEHQNGSSSSSSFSTTTDQLAKTLGKDLGKTLYKMYMSSSQYASSPLTSSSTTTTNSSTNSSILSGSIPKFLAQLMMSNFPQTAASAGRLLVYALQLTKVEKFDSRELYNWAYTSCNYSVGYPSYYGQSVCCYRNWRECCWQEPCPYYGQYSCYGCKSWYPPEENFIYNKLSWVSSALAPLFWFNQVQVDPSKLVSSVAPAFAPLNINEIFTFIQSQGNLSSMATMGGATCSGFMDSVKNLDLSGSFYDPSTNSTTSWNATSKINSILNVMEKICSKADKLHSVTNQPLPQLGGGTEKGNPTFSFVVSSPQNNNNTSSSSQRHHSVAFVVTLVFGFLIIVLTLVLGFILVRSIFGWVSCCGTNNSQQEENQSEEENEEEEDLVEELFNRPRNQILLLLNCILILLISFACISAVSYKQKFDEMDSFIKEYSQPEQLGAKLGKTLYKMAMMSTSADVDPTNYNGPDNNTFMGITPSVPLLIKNAMLLDLPKMAWNAARFTDRLDAAFINLCNEKKQPMPAGVKSMCDKGVGRYIRQVAGTIHGSLSPNLVFGSYEGNFGAQEGTSPVNRSATDSFFNPIALLDWGVHQLSPVGEFKQLNKQVCGNFSIAVKNLEMYGTWINAQDNNAMVSWDWTSTKTTISDAISFVCDGFDDADTVKTTTTTAMTSSSPTTSTAEATTTTETTSSASTTTGASSISTSAAASGSSTTAATMVPGTTSASGVVTSSSSPDTTTVSGVTGQTTITATSGAAGSTTTTATGIAPTTTTTVVATTTTTTSAPLPTQFMLTFSNPTGPTQQDLQASLQTVLSSVQNKSTVQLVIISNTTNSAGNRVIEFKLESTSANPSVTEQEALSNSVAALNNNAAASTIASEFGASQFAPESSTSPPTSSQPAADDGDDDKLPIIIGAAVGGVVLIAIISILVLRRKSSSGGDGYHSDHVLQNFEVGVVQAQRGAGQETGGGHVNLL